MLPKDVIGYIEGEPYISLVPVETGLTNIEKNNNGERPIGLNTEDCEINEGFIKSDIVFYVRLKDGLSQIIINIEAQKDNPKGYAIVNRGIYYVSRLISSQKERDFKGSNYDDIKRVYSIWICMNMKKNTMKHIHLIADDLVDSYNWEGNLCLFNIIMISLAKDLPENNEEYELHRLLGALLSGELTAFEKLNILSNEYDIPIEKNLRRNQL